MLYRPKTKEPKKRLRAGAAPIIRVGRRQRVFRDLYVNLLSMPWLALLPLVTVLYLLINLVFAGLYYMDIAGIENAQSFVDVYFFSVQTMATIGYGHMAPVKPMANALVTVEALVGFTFVAFITGLTFAKFSRPTANVLFSDKAVISNYEGKPHLKIRLANKRDNSIVDATARLFLLRYGVTKEGFPMRRFIDLPIIRDHMPVLRLTWTIMHPIDEDSPFFGMCQADMEHSDDELFVTIIGLDETLAQTIHTRHSYFPEEIIPGAFFEDVVKRNHDSVEIDYGKFHMVRHHALNEQPAEEEEDSNGKRRSAIA